jgi:hypothetical protein
MAKKMQPTCQICLKESATWICARCATDNANQRAYQRSVVKKFESQVRDLRARQAASSTPPEHFHVEIPTGDTTSYLSPVLFDSYKAAWDAIRNGDYPGTLARPTVCLGPETCPWVAVFGQVGQ